MKTAISFVIILSVHTASTFPQCDRPNGFTGALEHTYKMFKNFLHDASGHGFSRAHVVPWETIRAKIYEKEPSVPLAPWKTDIEELIKDLHTIDHEWFGNKELQKDQKIWEEYKLKNNDNKIKCKNYLENIDETQIQSMKTTIKRQKK